MIVQGEKTAIAGTCTSSTVEEDWMRGNHASTPNRQQLDVVSVFRRPGLEACCATRCQPRSGLTPLHRCE